MLYGFDGDNGSEPEAGLIFDTPGNLYGTTSWGGSYQYYGVAFQLAPNANGPWTETILHNFRTDDESGTNPGGGGTGCSAHGNSYGCGTVFEIRP